MYLECIKLFQKESCNLIKRDQILQTKLKGIYLTAPKNVPTPFIFMNFVKVTNLTSYNIITYEVNFDISIFTRDTSQEFDMLLGEDVMKILKLENYKSNLYKVLSLKMKVMCWSVSDILQKKLNLNYTTLLQQVRKT